MLERLNLNLSGTVFADEQHADVGAAAFEIDHDWFTREDLVIRTGAAGGGTLLVLDTDYQLSQESLDDTTKGVAGLSTRSGSHVFHKVQVINAAYQTGTLYFSGKYIGDSIDADDYNYLLSRLRPKGHLYGLVLSNNGTDPSNDVDVASGEAVDNGDGELMVLASMLTKQLDAAWAVGSGQGGLDTGGKASSTWYAFWLIKRLDTGVVDALFSLSATAPTMPTGYTKKRRVGWIRTDGSGNIRGFVQRGDTILWKTPTLDVDDGTLSTSRKLYTLPVPPLSPFRANISAQRSGGQPFIYLASPDVTDSAPSLTVAPLASIRAVAATVYQESQLVGIVDASSQVGMRADAASTDVKLAVVSYEDTRGRLA